METRLYKVTDRAGRIRLIDAGNPAQARNHCARAEYDVEVAKPHDVAALVQAGVFPEKVGAE